MQLGVRFVSPPDPSAGTLLRSENRPRALSFQGSVPYLPNRSRALRVSHPPRTVALLGSREWRGGLLTRARLRAVERA